MNIQENVSLKDYSTMRLGGNAHYLIELTSKNDVVKALEWAEQKSQPVLVIGSGSNLIFTDEGWPGLVLVNKIRGVVAVEGEDNSLVIACGAGENWDDIVEYCVQLGLTGIEAMSAIPGTAGATPIQNVGAYGQEISDTLMEVEAYDRVNKEFTVINNAACKFGYRDSLFKSQEPDRYVITGISMSLKKGQMEKPFYEALQNYLDDFEITDYSPASIREAVTKIRASKLPDPSKVANNGSFFKAAVVNEAKFKELEKEYPEIPAYETPNGYKIPAGWLLEKAGFKGYRHEGGMGTHDKHALVLVNYKAGNYQNLVDFRDEIKAKIKNMFGIELEQEPVEIHPPK